MKIIAHIGAHFTDKGRLVRSMLKNRDDLAKQGISIPGPQSYRDLLPQFMNKLKGEPAPQSIQDTLLEEMIYTEPTRRLVLSNGTFLCATQVVLDPNGLYSKIFKAAWLRNLFPNHEMEFALALRHPAALAQDIALNSNGSDFGHLASQMTRPENRWLSVVEALSAAVPDCALTIWRDEDTAQIWPDIMYTLLDPDPGTDLRGLLDMPAELLGRPQVEKLREALADDPPQNAESWHRRVGAFLEQHADSQKLWQDISLPGWDETQLAEITAAYETDCDAISKLGNVRFLKP